MNTALDIRNSTSLVKGGVNSELPKALQPICGETMLWHLLTRAEKTGSKKIVVVAGYKIGLVRENVGRRAQIVHQKELLGSGHAVNQAVAALDGFKGSVLVMYCDTPLISQGTIARLIKNHIETGSDGTLLSVELDNPFSYGRIQRDDTGHVVKIVEENDAAKKEKKIREINVGCYVFKKAALFGALREVRKNPRKREYYLTDVIEILAGRGKVEAVITGDREEVLGVNTRQDLANLEELMQERLLNGWIERGVRFRDPKTTVIDAGVKIGHDTVILPHTVIEDHSVIGKHCVIGPFARIRGGSKIGDGCVVSNFFQL